MHMNLADMCGDASMDVLVPYSKCDLALMIVVNALCDVVSKQ